MARTNGEGSVYYSERDGRWEAKITVGRKADGSLIRRKFVGPTRKAVTAKLKTAREALEQGLAVPDTRTTVAEFMTWWLADVLPGEGLAPKTVHWYGETARNYVIPAVGQRTLTGPRALTPSDVERMTADMTARGLAPSTAVAARTVLGKALRAAEQRGLVARNAARLARRPGDSGRVRKVKALLPLRGSGAAVCPRRDAVAPGRCRRRHHWFAPRRAARTALGGLEA